VGGGENGVEKTVDKPTQGIFLFFNLWAKPGGEGFGGPNVEGRNDLLKTCTVSIHDKSKKGGINHLLEKEMALRFYLLIWLTALWHGLITGCGGNSKKNVHQQRVVTGQK